MMKRLTLLQQHLTGAAAIVGPRAIVVIALVVELLPSKIWAH